MLLSCGTKFHGGIDCHSPVWPSRLSPRWGFQLVAAQFVWVKAGKKALVPWCGQLLLCTPQVKQAPRGWVSTTKILVAPFISIPNIILLILIGNAMYVEKTGNISSVERPGISRNPFSTQRRPQATGHETPFWLFLGFGGDVNVPVNLLTSCMLRELRGLGGVVGGC